MVQVESEAITKIDYNAAQSILLVRFADGDWYRYLDVPPSVYLRFVTADSHGRFFHDHVRDRYAFSRGR